MQQTLEQLNQTPGIVGSFIVGDDGMIVQANMSAGIDVDVVGALASAILKTAGKAVERLRQGPLRSVVLETERNKMFFFPTKLGYLATIASSDANLGLVRLEMKSAVAKLNAIDLTSP